MKHCLSLATLLCLAPLTGCAPVPGDDIDTVEQPIQVGPGQEPSPNPNPLPNPCLDYAPDATFSLPVPLTSMTVFKDVGASEPGGLYDCDYRVVEFRNVNGTDQYTGFNQVSVGTTTYPDMTEADCAASTFSGWVSAWHPPIGNVAGYWESIRSLPTQHAVWFSGPSGSSCNFDPGGGNLHYFSTTEMTGVTRLRMGSRLRVRHGGVWVRRPLQSQGLFHPNP